MRRCIRLFAFLSVACFSLSTARAEFDSSGSQAGPVQIQANRPQQGMNYDLAKVLMRLNGAPAGTVVIDVSGDIALINLKFIVAPPVRPVKPKPGPPRKPVPKRRKAPLLDPAKYISSGDW